MVAKKKILFFIVVVFLLGVGAEKILSTIVSNLDPEKYDIDILEWNILIRDTNLFPSMYAF